jgi:sugar/nucleoside kinase (ribokinase family)
LTLVSRVHIEHFAGVLGVLRQAGVTIRRVSNGESPEFFLEYELQQSQEMKNIEMRFLPGPGEIGSMAADLLKPGDHVHVCPLPLRDTQLIVGRAAQLGCLVSLQLHTVHLTDLEQWFDVFRQSRYVFSSEGEYCRVWKLCSLDAVFDAGSERLARITPTTTWIATSPGRVITISGGFAERVQTERVSNVVDPTGAGDVFAGATMSMIGLSDDLLVSVRVGAALAALKVTGYSSTTVLAALEKRPRIAT